MRWIQWLKQKRAGSSLPARPPGKLVLHIGMHKTGTTSFQQSLTPRVRERVIKDGWLLATTPGEVLVRSHTYQPQWVRQLGGQIRAGQNVLISHEGLSVLSMAQWSQLLHDLNLPSASIQTVMVFRHWNTWLVSRWQQSCKACDSLSFHSFIRQLLDWPQPRIDFDYDLCLLHPQQAGLAPSRVLGYEHALQAHGSILPDLYRATGLPPGGAHNLRTNVSLGQPITDTLRMLNAVLNRLLGHSDWMTSIGATAYQANPHVYYLQLDTSKQAIWQPLHQQLQPLLQESHAPVDPRLFQAIAIRQQKLEEATRGLVYNSPDGRLFPAQIEAWNPNQTFATLEFDDLPGSLKALAHRVLRNLGVLEKYGL